MKKCIRCSKPATLHITDIRDGKVNALHLCETCAHEYLSGGSPTESTSDAEMLAQKIQDSGADQDDDELEQLVCPSCGISYQEFRNEGRLGCPHDYEAFGEHLVPLIENIHGDTQHTGKFPKRAPDASRRQYELVKLRSDLRTAVENEDYEIAAELRDRINGIETED